MRRPHRKGLLPLAIASLVLAAAHDASAACGFYTAPSKASGAALINDADQVALMREGTRFALTMSTNYKGPLEDFAMVVPVPVVLKKENVKTLSPAIFTHLEKLTAPRVVEYDERDPCFNPPPVQSATAPGGAPGMGYGGGGGKGGGAHGVTVEAAFVVGEYEVLVLSAKESDGLEKWLKEHDYRIPDGAAAALAPYVSAQQKFVVTKIDSKKVLRDASGAVVLSPIRFVYETTDFRLPVRLGLLNAPKGGKQDLIIYLLSRGKRMESANYANVTIPTNVDVDASALTKLQPFYAALFDATLQKAGGKALVTEYVWGAEGCGYPCTTEALQGSEVGKLGADELFKGDLDLSEFVLTRLHTRYDGSTLSDDIVFRTAEPLAGGRLGDPGADDDKPVTMGGVDQFQARYAVRHPWTGPIACAAPVRGVWVERTRSGDSAALGLAAAARDVSLAAMIKSPIKALGLASDGPSFGAPPKVKPPEPPPKKVDPQPPDASSSRNLWIFGASAVAVLLLLLLVLRGRRSSDRE